MNPIEKAYSKLKTFLHKLADRTGAGLMSAPSICVDIFKLAECVNHFRACECDTARAGLREPFLEGLPRRLRRDPLAKSR
jgi:hypothetical protein